MDPYELFHSDGNIFQYYMSLDLLDNRTREFMEYVLDNYNSDNAKIYDRIMRQRSYDYIALLYLRGHNVELSSQITISCYTIEELIKLCNGMRILVDNICKLGMYDVADRLDDNLFTYSSSYMLLYLLHSGRSIHNVRSRTQIPNDWNLYELYKLNNEIIKKVEISHVKHVEQIYKIKEYDPSFDIGTNVYITGENRKEICTVLGIRCYDVQYSVISNYMKYLSDGYITTPPHLHDLKNQSDIGDRIRKYNQRSIFISASQHDIYYIKYLDINFKPQNINLKLCSELVLISKHGFDLSNVNVLIDNDTGIKNMTDLDYITLVRSGVKTVYIHYVYDVLTLLKWLEYFSNCEFRFFDLNSKHMDTNITSDVLNYREGIRKLLRLKYITPMFFIEYLLKNKPILLDDRTISRFYKYINNNNTCIINAKCYNDINIVTLY